MSKFFACSIFFFMGHVTGQAVNLEDHFVIKLAHKMSGSSHLTPFRSTLYRREEFYNNSYKYCFLPRECGGIRIL